MSRSASSDAQSCSSSTNPPPASTPRPGASSGSLIRELKSEGTTILLTTHYLDEAAELGDRAGIIAGGRLIDLGTIDELGGEDARVPVVRWRERGVLREERTTEPGAVVQRLMLEHGEPASLEIIRPSLEDIYLDLVGAHEQRGHGTSITSTTETITEETAA